MSARELRSGLVRGTDRADAPGGRKRLQSNADEAAPKRPKTVNNDEEEESNEEEEQPVRKAATKGKGKKGKKPMFVTYPYERLVAAYQLTTLQ